MRDFILTEINRQHDEIADHASATLNALAAGAPNIAAYHLKLADNAMNMIEGLCGELERCETRD